MTNLDETMQSVKRVLDGIAELRGFRPAGEDPMLIERDCGPTLKVGVYKVHDTFGPNARYWKLEDGYVTFLSRRRKLK